MSYFILPINVFNISIQKLRSSYTFSIPKHKIKILIYYPFLIHKYSLRMNHTRITGIRNNYINTAHNHGAARTTVAQSHWTRNSPVRKSHTSAKKLRRADIERPPLIRKKSKRRGFRFRSDKGDTMWKSRVCFPCFSVAPLCAQWNFLSPWDVIVCIPNVVVALDGRTFVRAEEVTKELWWSRCEWR